MKCKDCHVCKKGFLESKPEAYVCIGVMEPFEIYDINHDCTEYPEKNKETVLKTEPEDKSLTLIKDIYELIGDPVDYAELIGSPVPSSYGMYYVYTEPEHVLLDAAARMIAYQAWTITELQEQIDELTKLASDRGAKIDC